MTPEEQAALQARLAGPAPGLLGIGPDQAAAFRQRLAGASLGPGPLVPMGEAAAVAKQGLRSALDSEAGDRGEFAARLLGGYARTNPALLPATAGEYVARKGMQAAGLAPPEAPDTGKGDPLDLSKRAQGQLRVDSFNDPSPLRQLVSPDVAVQAAPTLDPRYAQIGRPLGGGAGGGGVSAAGGLKSAYEAAQRRQLGAFDEQKGLEGQLGMDKAGRIEAVGSLEEVNAARMQRDAELQERAEAAATAKLQAFMDRNAQLADEIGKAKTDPGRLMRSADAGTQITIGIGAALGGALAGLNGGSNSSLDRLDRLIDRDIRSQEQEIDNKKTALSARQSIFGQMLQETGDRRLAAHQTRNLMYEAMKTKLRADSDRLGIPEVRTNADLTINAIEQRQSALNKDMTKEAYDAYMRQAAAAASAQRAAEERAWQRSMEVAKLGFERDKLEIEKQKAMGLTGEDLNKQTQSLGKELSDKELAQGRTAVDNAKRRLEGLKADEGLPGVGQAADLREQFGARPTGINTINPIAWATHGAFGLSDQEKVSRGDWDKIKLSYQSQITGSGASENERKMLSEAFEGAKSPAEQRNAIKQADDFFSRRESAIKAGFDPRAVAVFEQRLNGIRPELPTTVKVKK